MREFFAMGGYGLYVWGSVGVTALLMIIEPLLIVRRRQIVLRRLSRRHQRSQSRSQRRQQELNETDAVKVEHEA